MQEIRTSKAERFEVVLPIIVLLSSISSFIFANSKIKFAETGDINNLYQFLIWFIKYINSFIIYTGIVFSLVELRLEKKRKVIYAKLLFLCFMLIYSLETRDLDALSSILFMSSIVIAPPNGLETYFVPAILSFILGFISGSPEWLKEKLLFYMLLPHIFMIFARRNEEKSHTTLSYLVISLSLFFSLRFTGALEGLFLLFVYSIKLAFPALAYLSLIPLPFISFVLGFFYIFEFQKGISPTQYDLFISKVHIPLIITFGTILFIFFFFLFVKLFRRNSKKIIHNFVF